MDSFKQFSKRSSGDRKGHLSWGKDDVEYFPKVKSRKGHLSWGKDDVEYFPRESLREDDQSHSFVPAADEYEHTKFSKAMLRDQLEHRGTAAYDRNAHMEYKDDSQGMVNGNLRSNYDKKKGHIESRWFTPNDRNNIKKMDHITGRPSIEPTKTFRGYDEDYPIDKLRVGDEIKDQGYTGTTLDRHTAHSFAGMSRVHPGHKMVAIIHAPAGTKGHLLDHPNAPGTTRHDEDEYTFNRGLRLRVVGHSTHVETVPGNGIKKYHFVHMHAVGQDPAPLSV